MQIFGTISLHFCLNLMLLTTQVRLGYSTRAGPSHIFFKEVGESVHRLEYANVEINLDITPTLDLLFKLKATLQDYKTQLIGKLREEKKMHYAESVDWQQSEFRIMEVDRLISRVSRLQSFKEEIPAATHRN
jgi:hypothetical protein